ncbi:MAG: GntR family transcriptional regulator [Acidobacteriia bacterium]|nr:GntR family transcriptional regulator [Terriglobia bacterium]
MLDFNDLINTKAALPFSIKLEELSESLGRKVSISDQIAEVLRTLIISGELNPGDRIVESRVAKQLSVGQPTVREALVTLEHQGLVVRKTNQGCIVTILTREEISQILKVRGELEVLAVELAAEFASTADITELLEITRAMKAAGDEKDVNGFFSHDFRFHERLWKASGNIFLPRLLSQLMLPLLAFLFIRNLRHNSHINMSESAEAHAELAKVILLRDKVKARTVAEQKFKMFSDQHLNLYQN